MGARGTGDGSMNETPQQAARRLAAKAINDGYKPEALHEYKGIDGNIIYWRMRLKHPDERKWIRPMYLNGRGYEIAEPQFRNGKPLYRLPELSASPNDPVWFVEGEWAADHLARIGVLATTSGSAESAKHADLSPLAKRDVIIWPGNDEPGLRHAQEVAERLAASGATVRLVDIAKLNLPVKGDVMDWLALYPDATVAVLDRLPMVAYAKAEEWSEPNPIKAELAPVEPLPTAIIPEPYRARIADASERMQTPPDFMATAAIVMTGSVIGTACTIKPKRRDDWQVVPNLWGGAVGRPSVLLKTPAMKEALNPLARLEMDAKQAYEAEQQQHEADIEVHKAGRDAIRDRIKKAAKGKAVSAENIAELKLELCNLNAPDEPIWRRYKTNDATIEKCNELMRDNPRGLLLFRDELVGLLAGWEKPGHESDRAYFLEGWSGNQGHIDDRIGRGTTYAENVCISLYGGIQPAKLQSYLYKCMRGLENDGLMQRLQLAVYPDEPKSWQLVDRYPDTEAKNRVYKIIEALSRADFEQYGAQIDDGDKFPSLRFDDDAQALFYEWLAELQEKLQGDDEPVVLEHLGKYRSLMPSLALIFHLIEIADGTAQPGPVSMRAAELAAAWCDYLESHARRIYGLVTNATKQAAATLAGKIRKGKLNDGFTVRDVYRQNWHLLTDRESAKNACDELVADGWLREHVTPASFGQKGKIAFLINPKAKVQ